MKRKLVTPFLIITFLLIDAPTTYIHAQKLQWAKGAGSTGADESLNVATDASGNVYATGWFQGTMDFDPSSAIFNLTSGDGSKDIFITKLDASGNFIWARAMGGNDEDYGQALTVDALENVFITGYFNETADFDPGAATFNMTSAGFEDIFILRLDASGNFVWARRIGGPMGDYGTSLALDGNGNVYTTGRFSETADFDPGAGTYDLTSAGGDDIFVSKLDPSGNFLRAERMGGSSMDYANGITADPTGVVTVTGSFGGTCDFDPSADSLNLTSLGLLGDAYVFKLGAAGNLLWAKAFNGLDHGDSFGIASDAAGNVYTTGAYFGTVDFDPGADTYNLIGVSTYDIFVSKLDASGNFVWAKGMGGVSIQKGFSIGLDGAGNVYTAGQFSTTVDFDPGPAVFNITSTGEYDIFISKLDPSGNFVWASKMGGPGVDVCLSIAVHSSGNIYATGRFELTADFDPGTGTNNLVSVGSDDIFISKLDGVLVSIDDQTEIQEINIYPNPCNGIFAIRNKDLKGSSVEIFNVMGESVHKQIIDQGKLTTDVDLSDQPGGMYFIRIVANQGSATRDRLRNHAILLMK